MSWSKHRRSKSREGYHHGDLREALVRAALDLIATKGPAGFTFADAARSTGVSPAAPYRHFRDRDELLADVARRGFDLFASALEKAWNNGDPDPFTGLQNIGRAYLAFALEQPSYYTAMFEAGLPPDMSPELTRSGERAFGVLRQAAEVFCATLPKQHRPPAMMVSRHVWALSHGVASLFGRGDKAARTLPVPAEDLLEAGLLIYLRGLRGDG